MTQVRTSPELSRVRRFGPFVAGAMTVLIACREIIPWALSGGAKPYNWLVYNLAILAPNYLQNGFIRRGLGGTVLMLIDGHRILHPIGSLATYQLVTATFFALPVALLLRRLAVRRSNEWLWLGIVLLLSPQTFRGWGNDIGRGDLLSLGFVAWALILAIDQRMTLAVVTLAIGSLGHETVLFYGVPLVGVVWIVDHGRGEINSRRGLALIGLMALLLVTNAVLQRVFGDNAQAIAKTIHDGGPPFLDRDVAAYMTVTGFRSIETAWCVARSQFTPLVAIVGSVVVLAMHAKVFLIRSWRMLGLVAFASLLPFLAISVVAIDYGRWAMMAVATGWLATVALRVKALEPAPATRADYGAAIMLFSALIVMKTATLSYPNYASWWVAQRYWGYSRRTLSEFVPRCDPYWKEAIGLLARR